MRILIIGDTHIEERAIPELIGIFNEIVKVDADKVVHLGDYFEKNKPTPYELKFGTVLANELLKKYKDVTIISGTGEHDIYHDVSVIEYLSELGINIVRGDYVYDNILFGHFMLYESKLEYGSGKCGVKDLKKYKYVFLGHQHNPQDITDKIFHVGSVRYQHFNEVEDKFKRIALLDTEKNTLEFIPLKSPMKMVDVYSIQELPNITPGKVKVRLVISSFDQFKKEINEIEKVKHKYNELKIKLNFTPDKSIPKIIKNDYKKKQLKDVLIEGIANIKDKEVRDLLKEQIDDN